jgi:diguanylate cyclase (GGDEF)-like protein
MAAFLHKKFSKALEIRATVRYEDGNVLPNGMISGESIVTPIFERDGSINYVVCITRDITERKKSEDLLREYAYHDDLTRLYNRRYLLEHVRRPAALYLFDIDHFKNINDTLGHDTGDALLKEAAERLTRRFGSSEYTAVRLGGDEFLIVSSSASDNPADVAADILGLFSRPFVLHDRPMKMSASVGVTVGTNGEDVPTMLKQADIALYRAKGEGRKRFHIYEPSYRYDHVVRFSHELELAYALERNELELLYQPIYDPFKRTVVGAEALLRWNHAGLGGIPPGDFIPVAEETGLIIPIGEWTLRRACLDWHVLREVFGPDFKVSVNISRYQLNEPGFANRLLHIVQSEEVSPLSVELEITESMVLHDIDNVRELLSELRSLGFTISLDDFGTGYSSLSMLTLLPIDTLKIDRAFVHNMNPPLLSAILAMARALRLHVIAEGVEEYGQYKQLVEMDCPGLQGYLICRPLKLGQLLAERARVQVPVFGDSPAFFKPDKL